MTCRDVSELVGAYLADELGGRAGRRFEAHLAACGECVAYVRGYRDTIRLARAAYAEPETGLQ